MVNDLVTWVGQRRQIPPNTKSSSSKLTSNLPTKTDSINQRTTYLPSLGASIQHTHKHDKPTSSSQTNPLAAERPNLLKQPYMSSTSKSNSGSRTPTKRLIEELSNYNVEPPISGIQRLAPINDDLFHWQSVILGAGLPPSAGYSSGRWLLDILIPSDYPQKPPRINFLTKICHPNIGWETGEVCLDLLKENWTPVVGIAKCVEAIRMLLVEPGTDSPLNVEVAALIRDGDGVGARGLVGFWSGEERWVGE